MTKTEELKRDNSILQMRCTHQDIVEENLEKERERTKEMFYRLEAGRHYLMGIEPKDLTVEDTLEAFGFGRDGLE